MTKFQDTRPIFMQIVDYVGEKILAGDMKVNEMIPSVREMAIQLEVNPNTVVRAYERLTLSEIVINKRGVGYFVSPTALRRLRSQRRKAFVEDMIPTIRREVGLLEISSDELIQLVYGDDNK